MEITVNIKTDNKFGWGYSFNPTGEGTKIALPKTPDHEGTLAEVGNKIANDATWNAHRQGAFHATSWFYDGQRITATYGFGLIEHDPNYVRTGSYDNAKYGKAWFTGFDSELAEKDGALMIRVVDGPGRPSLDVERHNITITRALWQKADLIGEGNASDGIRKALEAY